MNKRAFLSFKITGLDRNKVLEISNRLEMIALKMHLQPVNPMRIVPQSVANSDSEQAWRQAMTITFPELLACNTIIIYKPSIESSPGVSIELVTALNRGYTIHVLNPDFSTKLILKANEKNYDPIDSLYVASTILRGMELNDVSK